MLRLSKHYRTSAYGFTSVKYFMDRSYLSVHWFPFPFTISTTVVTSYHAWQLASAFPLHLFCHPIRIERPVLAAWAAATLHYFWRILRGQTSLKKFSLNVWALLLAFTNNMWRFSSAQICRNVHIDGLF